MKVKLHFSKENLQWQQTESKCYDMPPKDPWTSIIYWFKLCRFITSCLCIIYMGYISYMHSIIETTQAE
jgi:hypothetical protein